MCMCVRMCGWGRVRRFVSVREHGCSMHVSKCVYVYIYVCMYVCVYVCMHACMYVCTHVCLYVCVYVCMYVGGVEIGMGLSTGANQEMLNIKFKLRLREVLQAELVDSLPV